MLVWVCVFVFKEIVRCREKVAGIFVIFFFIFVWVVEREVIFEVRGEW